MPKESCYPSVPELDWIRDLADQTLAEADADLHHQRNLATVNSRWATARQLTNLYRYLLWSRRYALLHTLMDRPGQAIAEAFVTKYHRLVYGIELSKAEEQVVEKGYKAHKLRLAAWRTKDDG